MSQSSNGPSRIDRLPALLAGILLALPLTWVLLRSSTFENVLRAGVIRGPKPGGDRSYDQLLYTTIALKHRPPSERELSIYLTGSSVIALNVAIPLARETLRQTRPDLTTQLQMVTGGHATVRDVRRWLKNLPTRKPDVLLFGVYYNTLQPSHRRPDMRLWFPMTNAAYLRLLYASATLDTREEWDPDGAAPRLVAPWSAKRHPVDTDQLLRPYDPFPNEETQALRDLASYCRKHQTRLILVRTPIHPLFLPVYRAARHYQEYGEALDAARGEGAEVWDFEASLREPTEFHDLVHTSPTGRERFTRMLATRLATRLEAPGDLASAPSP